MTFEKFRRSRPALAGTPMVSILKHGTMGFNRACSHKYLKDYKCVTLFYDKKMKCIGIQPSNTQSEDSYNIRTIGASKSATISASSFLKYYGISHIQTRVYRAEWSNEEKMIICDLQQKDENQKN